VKSSVRPPPIVDPQPEDLLHLPSLHGILGALNDPAAGIHQLKEYCSRLPSLGNRIVAAAALARPGREDIDLGYALAVLGNRGLGEVLLQYLEDLTVLKAELEEQRLANVMASPQLRPERQPRAGAGPRGLT
jgi:hypothetical protein